jgi:ATP-dependent Lon protease
MTTKLLDKLKSKIKDLEDKYDELNTNIEDIYENIQTPTITTENHSNKDLNSEKDTQPPQKYNKSFKNYNHFIEYLLETNKKQSSTQSSTQSIKEDSKTLIDLLRNVVFCNADKLLDDTVIYEYLNYFVFLDDSKRKDLIENFKNMNKYSSSNINNINKPKLFKIMETQISEYHKKMIISKLQQLDEMDKTDPEYFKLSQWVDNILDIPFNHFIQPNYQLSPQTPQTPKIIIQTAREKLDTVIYGQKQTKQHILEIIARMISNPQTSGSVFAVEGEPGTGKTSLIKNGFAQVVGLPFVFISLGGTQDSSYLIGENYTYIGSKCGKIIQALKHTKCMNPIFYFDELDKVSNTERGQEIINLLIHITDPTQNTHFYDQYMDGITVDLSRAIFIFSFNDRSLISPILLDRMEIIKFNNYTLLEKEYITEHFLLPSVIKKYYGDKPVNVKIRNKGIIMKKLILTRPDKLNKRNISSSSSSRFNMLNIHYIAQRNKSIKLMKHKQPGGVRYIMHRLERVVARININHIETFNNINTQNNGTSNTKLKVVIDSKVVKDVLSSN